MGAGQYSRSCSNTMRTALPALLLDTCCSVHGSILSRVGASTKPGAVQIQRAIAARASLKSAQFSCQTHSSLSERKKRSIMPLCSGVTGGSKYRC
jgi:hypothetical protein